MPSSVKLNGRIYHKGDSITFNQQARGILYAPAGLTVKILFINGSSVGLYSPHALDEWGDLDGEVDSQHGWWIDTNHLEQCVEGYYEGTYEISGKLEHRGVELGGKPCRMLAGLDDGTVFVEFNEDVNGCSADGLGKAGHCVAVKTKILTKKKRVKHAQ